MSESQQPNRREQLIQHVGTYLHTHWYDFRNQTHGTLKDLQPQPYGFDPGEAAYLSEKRFEPDMPSAALISAIVDGRIRELDSTGEAVGITSQILGFALLRRAMPTYTGAPRLIIAPKLYDPAGALVVRDNVIIGGIAIKTQQRQKKDVMQGFAIATVRVNVANLGFDDLMTELARGRSPDPDTFVQEQLDHNPRALDVLERSNISLRNTAQNMRTQLAIREQKIDEVQELLERLQDQPGQRRAIRNTKARLNRLKEKTGTRTDFAEVLDEMGETMRAELTRRTMSNP